MIVNQQALQGLYVGFNTLYNKAFKGTEPQWGKLATKVTSNTGAENYKWLGLIPKMREWIGDRQIKSLEASDYTIKNKDYELTVGIPRNDIEDDTIGVYSPVVESMGQSAAQLPDELVFGLLKGGFEQLCYDGKPFFAGNHKGGSNKGTAKLSVDAYAAARASMMSLKDNAGKPLGIVPDLLVVPPALEGMARKILMAEQIDGTTNTMRGTATLLVSPLLAGADNAWYLLCTTQPVKPLVYQERKPPKFVSLTSDTDPHVFARKQYVYGVDGRCNAGYTLWQLAWGSDGSKA